MATRERIWYKGDFFCWGVGGVGKVVEHRDEIREVYSGLVTLKGVRVTNGLSVMFDSMLVSDARYLASFVLTFFKS